MVPNAHNSSYTQANTKFLGYVHFELLQRMCKLLGVTLVGTIIFVAS